MTSNEFVILCNEFNIYPSIALEMDSIKTALRNRDNEEVRRILKEDC